VEYLFVTGFIGERFLAFTTLEISIASSSWLIFSATDDSILEKLESFLIVFLLPLI